MSPKDIHTDNQTDKVSNRVAALLWSMYLLTIVYRAMVALISPYNYFWFGQRRIIE